MTEESSKDDSRDRSGDPGGSIPPGGQDPLEGPVRGSLQGAQGRRRRRRSKPEIAPTAEERFFDRFKYVVVALLVAGVVVLAAVLVLRWFSGETAEEDGQESRLKRLLERERFGQAYLEANGGREFLESIRSLRAVGRLETPERTSPFLLFKKAPDKSLFRLEMDEATIRFGTDGDDVWRSIARDGRVRQVILLEGDDARRVRRMGRFFGGLLEHFLRGRGSFLSIDARSTPEGDFFVVAIRGDEPEASLVEYWVDAESLDLARSVETRDGVATETRFSDYREIGFLRQPYRVETRTGGEWVSTAVLEETEMNPGILSLSFERPVTEAPGRNPGAWSMEKEVRKGLEPTGR